MAQLNELEKALEASPVPPPPSEESHAYRVTTSVFEGPLDLLLHLIRKDQIDIYDIPIAKICQSYYEHLEMMKIPDVNIAGEFMVMAATLTHLKSVLLLPKEETLGEEDDPRLPLVQQLLMYETFKKAALQIDHRPWLYRDIYPHPTTHLQRLMPTESLMDAPIDSVDPFQLMVCLKIALQRTTRPPMEISADTTSIREKVGLITQQFDATPVFEFSQLLPDPPLRRDIIISFLAILELARLHFIEIYQAENFGPIQIQSVRSLRDLDPTLLEQY